MKTTTCLCRHKKLLLLVRLPDQLLFLLHTADYLPSLPAPLPSLPAHLPSLTAQPAPEPRALADYKATNWSRVRALPWRKWSKKVGFLV